MKANAKAGERLRRAGLRVTKARELILDFLAKGHGPYTIEKIHLGMRSRSCDLVTVYRSLSTLQQVGLVRVLHLGDRQTRYELSRPEHPHHHVVCQSCQRVEILDGPARVDIQQQAEKHGFRNVSPWLEVFGTCSRCA